MGCSVSCWVPPLPFPARSLNFLEERSLWPCQWEIQRRPDHWWSTKSRLNCWSPLRGQGGRKEEVNNTTKHKTFRSARKKGSSPEVVRGRAPRWLHVGGVLLLGGEPTVKTTVRGLADPPWAMLGAAGRRRCDLSHLFHSETKPSVLMFF